MTTQDREGSSRKILVIGAGELAMPVLRNVARRTADVPGASVNVLLRPAAIGSASSSEQKDIAEIRALEIEIIPGDLVLATGALRNLNHIYAADDSASWLGLGLFLASLAVMGGGVHAARPVVIAGIAQLFGKVSGR
ncbi:hypothetical protein MRBLWO14_002411 [Microbacterium sp. LWO14-1.2]|uniref:hypothetical protein n=1 Tax=unclassified Microbacterium TaxID=2609290 RepID=UPI00313A0DFE